MDAGATAELVTAPELAEINLLKRHDAWLNLLPKLQVWIRSCNSERTFAQIQRNTSYHENASDNYTTELFHNSWDYCRETFRHYYIVLKM